MIIALLIDAWVTNREYLVFIVVVMAASLTAAMTTLATMPQSVVAAPCASWKLAVTPAPTNLAPGPKSRFIRVVAVNVGGGPTCAPAVLKTTLPAKLKALKATGANGDPLASPEPTCTIEAPTNSVTCPTLGAPSEAITPHRMLLALIEVQLTPAAEVGEELEIKASVEGGGASQAVSASAFALVQPDPVEFDFLSGFSAPLTKDDGAAATLGKSHPYQFTVDFGFPTENPGSGLTGAGHPRDVFTELPPGLAGDPAATPVLCTEVQLVSEKTSAKGGCPDASQVGVVDVTTLAFDEGGIDVETSNLYNMVPPSDKTALFGFNGANVGIFIHLRAKVRNEGDYGVTTGSPDLLALGANPIFAVRAQIWGDPSGASHDRIRGDCLLDGKQLSDEPCPVPPQERPFLTLPGRCSGEPLDYRATANSWEEPDVTREATYESADLAGNPVVIGGCEGLEFEPSIKIQPTTYLTDSPSGLEVDLHQPLGLDGMESRASAALKDAIVTLPEGMTVNPSQAAGLDACSPAQIGLKTPVGQSAPIHFTGDPQSCPDAAKIGTVEVATPLLAQYDADHKVIHDPETGDAIPEPLNGSLYIAQPFQNPFDSLLAVYLVIEDARRGIVAKLAGEVKANPLTGQLASTFTENPELPLEDIHVELFGGARGPLTTPPTCTESTATADLTPWSAPQAPGVVLQDSFTPTAAPGGGPCPTAAAQMPSAPALRTGTLSPQAGAFSPLVFKLTREDGSQRLAKIETTLPPGLSARLAGVAICSEAAIAKAISREEPGDGALERDDPSCPTASEVGFANVGAGSGPTPYYTQGRAYLAGPYKGAPLSLAIITPAVAGPFDLGAVVVRTAIYLDPTTAQGRAVSDPLPTILEGIPVNVRSVALYLSRNQFTFNPTSCDPMAIAATATTTLGTIAPLSERFQAAGCASLAYKPQLHTRIYGETRRGGNPRFRAVFQAKAGHANTARVSFTLPRSEFIEQGHFRTICTRVQYAANQCPPGSIYGHVKAISPQLDYPVEGPIYLRSSNNELPDIVLALRGPAHQPIAIDLVGRVDSVNGRLRTTFTTVPDAPVSKAIVTMQGKSKSLFQNSTNVCKGTHRSNLRLLAQNGKTLDAQPALKAGCGKGKGKGGKGKGKGGKGKGKGGKGKGKGGSKH
jgi:hypothetical protein